MTLDDLDTLLNQVEEIGGPKFVLRAEWVVEAPDPLAMYALERLLGLTHAKVEEPAEPIGEKYHGSGSWVTAPDPVLPASKEPKEIKAWRVLDADENVVEQLTITERNAKMARGEFAEGTILHHPRAGKQRITRSGPGQGMEPVE
ncbi:MAG: hypothetical protein CVU44_11155 [Chloroflexi bacterium HGW-Chloroflexi-6]|nr:MAG: hypothetical protein CVU44_11155 [Chloroflexi bacterium HGW-Chloroflexi-6]